MPTVEGELGVAVSVTVSVLPKPLLEHNVPEAVPPVLVQLRLPLPPLDVTLPLPVPEKASVTVLLSVNVVCACEMEPLAVR